MKVYIIGSLKSTQDFIAKATENVRGKLRVEHENVSNDIEFKQLTAYQLSRSSIKDADYVVFLEDQDLALSSNVDNVPFALYFGDETPENFIKAQIKFELENVSAFNQTTAVVPEVEKKSQFSFLSIFGKSNSAPTKKTDEALGLEMRELSDNKLKN